LIDTVINTDKAALEHSVFRRSMVETCRHYGEQHPQSYLTEFDFRMRNRFTLGVTNAMRAVKA
jgi:hypothetical protein